MNIEEQEWIDKDTVRYFIWSVKKFFRVTTKIEPELGAPYLLSDSNYSNYTGVIGVSGSQRGAVYFNIGTNILDEVLKITYPEVFNDSLTEEGLEIMRKDYTGEIANIISGNVRNYMGENFLISVPAVVSKLGDRMEFKNAEQAILFPISWKGFQCDLILNFERGSQLGESHELIPDINE